MLTEIYLYGHGPQMEYTRSRVLTRFWLMILSYPRQVRPIQMLQSHCGMEFGNSKPLTKSSTSCGRHQMTLYLYRITFVHDMSFLTAIADCTKNFRRTSFTAFGCVTMLSAFGSQIKLSTIHVQGTLGALVTWCPSCFQNVHQVLLCFSLW